MEAEEHPLAEECARLLAAAANAERLYPPSSNLPEEALVKLVDRLNNVTSTIGPLRYIIDPHAFRIGENVIAAGLGPGHRSGRAPPRHAGRTARDSSRPHTR